MLNRTIGLQAEQLAAAYLIEKGYSIIGKNFHSRYGEIDLIAKQRQIYVFVEVKSRKSCSFGEPEEAINAAKLLKIYRSIFHFFKVNKLASKNIDWRIDLIAIKLSSNFQVKTINHYQNIGL